MNTDNQAEEESAQEGTETASTSEEIDMNTDNWLTYRNEEYGFETKCPGKWYWEDYTEEFGFSKIGFYPENKKRGYEYIGNITVGLNGKDFKYFVEGAKKVKDQMEREENTINYSFIEKKSKNNYDVLIEYNSPNFMPSNSVVLDCGKDFIITMNSYFLEEVDRKILELFADNIYCY